MPAPGPHPKLFALRPRPRGGGRGRASLRRRPAVPRRAAADVGTWPPCAPSSPTLRRRTSPSPSLRPGRRPLPHHGPAPATPDAYHAVESARLPACPRSRNRYAAPPGCGHRSRSTSGEGYREVPASRVLKLPERDNPVLATEAETVRQRHSHRHLPCIERHVVEVALRVGRLEVDCRRHNIVANSEDGSHR